MRLKARTRYGLFKFKDMQVNLIHTPNNSDRDPITTLMQQCGSIKLWNEITHKNTLTAISIAHKQIVRDAKNKGLKEVLICENDLIFTNHDSFKQFLDHKPDDYDIYLAGVSSFTYTNRVESFTGLFFYMINERFYDTFLECDESINLDYTLKGKGSYKIHNPPLVKTKNGYSSSAKKQMNYTKNWDSVKNKLNFLDKKKSFIFE